MLFLLGAGTALCLVSFAASTFRFDVEAMFGSAVMGLIIGGMLLGKIIGII